MEVLPTRISDVKLIKPRVFGDARGFFMETWNARAFAEAGIDATFVQDNHSRSVQYTLRGLHYQIRQPQGKLVRVTRGEVFDVAVDLRQGSPTFGQWVGEVLSEENQLQMWVPPGFAHGFYVMSESADFQYKCTDFYAPDHERCIRWDDNKLAIDWQLSDGEKPIVSSKDSQGLSFLDAEYFLL
ncbi:dTDP-4-dehydrorhamnose 3,5-epimerase [Halomonas sp. LR5S13]|uniref:dTDP-4-dehydrorhamnose 3,5-epimerase n=1 Tax=Halomonas rhizosphaerae TaxID=3043296 RepID=UPI0024A84323|nr:dTDP-4-dehydrorhamnose 3,5-epimerase [Halomonas rhizosphaerae]MDI5920999.1 dTDP-4-dehydrorhamnose 3,5-epimerase [Halomonas rhizosphaerae]